MSKQRFLDTIASVASAIGDRPLDDRLAAFLNAEFPKCPSGDFSSHLSRLSAVEKTA